MNNYRGSQRDSVSDSWALNTVPIHCILDHEVCLFGSSLILGASRDQHRLRWKLADILVVYLQTSKHSTSSNPRMMAGSGRHVNLWESNLIGGFEHLIGGVEIRCLFGSTLNLFHGACWLSPYTNLSWLTTPLFWIRLVIWKAKMISAKYPLYIYIYISPSPRLPSSKMEHCCALPSCVFLLHWTIVIIPSVQNVIKPQFNGIVPVT